MTMEDEESASPPRFTLLHNRGLPFSGGEPLLSASCCPTMDLVALASSTQISLQRSIKWEMLFSVGCAATCLAWRPDGKALCVGHEDGSLGLFDVESGEELPLPYSTRPHSTAIRCMYWTSSTVHVSTASSTGDDYDAGIDPLSPLYSDRALKSLFPPPPPPKGSLGTAEKSQVDRGSSSIAATLMGSRLFGLGSQYRPSLEVLVSGDDSGVVTLSAFGYFPIGCVDLSAAFGPDPSSPKRKHVESDSSKSTPRLPQVSQVCLSADLQYLVAVLKLSIPSSDMTKYRVVTVDTSLLADRALELRHVAAVCGYIGEHISNALDVIRLMCKEWNDGIQPLKKHLQPLLHQLRCFERPNTAEQELFMMLTSGVTSSALQQYISGVTEQTFQRLGKTLDCACAAVESLGTNHLLRAAEALVFRLSDMMGLAQWEDKFARIGLEPEYIESLKRAAELLLLKVHETIIWTQDARANFAALTVWLQSVVRKQNGREERNQGGIGSFTKPKEPLPIVDVERLIDLLGDSPTEVGLGLGGSIPPLLATEGTENSRILHRHVSDQFDTAPLSTHTRNLRIGQPQQDQSWHNVTGDPRLPHISVLSLRQVIEILRERWLHAFHKPSEEVSTGFSPVHNIPLFSLPGRNPSKEQDRRMAIHFRTIPGAGRSRKHTGTTPVMEGDQEECEFVKGAPFQLLFAFGLNSDQLQEAKYEGNHESKIWILRYCTSDPSDGWYVASVAMGCERILHDLAFYGEAPGGANVGNSNISPRLVITYDQISLGEEDSRSRVRFLSTIGYDDLEFHSLRDSHLFNSGGTSASSTRKYIENVLQDPLVQLNERGVFAKLVDATEKSRILTPSSWNTSFLAVSGMRGVATVFTDNNRFQLFDMEEDEEVEEEQE